MVELEKLVPVRRRSWETIPQLAVRFFRENAKLKNIEVEYDGSGNALIESENKKELSKIFKRFVELHKLAYDPVLFETDKHLAVRFEPSSKMEKNHPDWIKRGESQEDHLVRYLASHGHKVEKRSNADIIIHSIPKPREGENTLRQALIEKLQNDLDRYYKEFPVHVMFEKKEKGIWKFGVPPRSKKFVVRMLAKT